MPPCVGHTPITQFGPRFKAALLSLSIPAELATLNGMTDSPLENPGLLTLGTAQLGAAYGIVNAGGMPPDGVVAELLDVAIQGGIRCLDTARAYGIAEERLGRWLAGTPPAPTPAIITKIPKMPLEVEQPAQWLTANFRQSLEALGRDRIAGLLLHSSADLFRPGVKACLTQLRASGQVGRVGVSAYDPEQVFAALEWPELGVVQVPASILDRRMERSGVLDACRRAGVSVFVRSVYLQGLLAAPSAALPAAAAGLAPCLERLDRIAAAADITRQGLCLAAVLRHPGVTSLVVGAETPDQIRQSLAAAEMARHLPDAILDEAEAALRDAPEWIHDPRLWKANGL